MKKKVLLIVILCVALGVLGTACSKDDSGMETPEVDSSLSSSVEEESEEPVPEEPKLEYFETDSVINEFFVQYNSVSDNPINASDITGSIIRSKAFVNFEGCSMEVDNATDFFSVSISTAPEDEDTLLHEVFTACVKAMNSNISNEELDTAWSDIHETGYMVEEYEFVNGIVIDYIPYKELSQGHSNLRIDLTFPLE